MTTQPPKKKRVNSKGKGNGFENVIAKKLSVALDPLKFIRTQGSGARVGGKNFETIGQMFGEDALKLFVGDVVCVNEKQVIELPKRFRFSIECKFYKTQDPFTSLVSGTSNLFRWMQEAIDDAKKVERAPMLIFKWNNTPIFVATLQEDTHGIGKKISMSQNGLTLDIFYLDDLMADQNFWFTFD